MKVGFTGTQKGMTPAQSNVIIGIMRRINLGQTITEIHHGGCIGADSDFHNLCRSLKLCTPTVHPASDVADRKRANLSYAIYRYAKPALERNHDIVDSVDIILAAPAEAEEIVRSGTWSTIRYARKIGKSYYIIEPSGRARRRTN